MTIVPDYQRKVLRKRLLFEGTEVLFSAIPDCPVGGKIKEKVKFFIFLPKRKGFKPNDYL
jgi:hypothetical protein